MSCETYLSHRPDIVDFVKQIRAQKDADARSRPSATLMDRSDILTADIRARLLDKIASLVDENLTGRSDMCLQYAELLSRALNHLGLPARVIVGTGMYFDNSGEETYRWRHAWVRVDDEVIDGNVDSVPENPKVPRMVLVAPYFGPLREMPDDRRLREDRDDSIDADVDVDDLWWPELKEWLDAELKAQVSATSEVRSPEAI